MLIHIAELDCKHVLPGNGWATCTIPAEWLDNEVQQVGRHLTIQATVASCHTATRVIALLNQDLHMFVQTTTVKQLTHADIITVSHYIWCDRGSTHAYVAYMLPRAYHCATSGTSDTALDSGTAVLVTNTDMRSKTR